MKSTANPTPAAIALGANLGDREAAVGRALALLGQTPGVRLLRVSSMLENPAIGGPADSPTFLNAAALVETTLSPEALLDRLLEIEQQLGRQRRQRWAPRTIDLDVLLYGDQIIQTDRLTIPHPRMHQRRFVLEPLAEIAPDLVHPVLGSRINDLLASTSP